MDLIKISLSGTVIILIILALRRTVSGKLPKRLFLILWLIAVVTLVLPFPAKTPVSLLNLKTADTIHSYTAQVREEAGEKYSEPQVKTAETRSSGIDTTAVEDYAQTALTAVWAAAAAFLCLYFAVRYLKALKVFKTSLPLRNEFAQKWLCDHPLRRKISLRVSDKISSPLTYGTVKPVILLPKTLKEAGETEMECILAHEYVHIKYFDSLYKIVLAAALVIHWFNPLVWAMFFTASRDQELACDESVLNMTGVDEKKRYALLLINLEEKKAELNAACSFGAASIKERIKNIMKIKKKTIGSIIASGIIICGLTTAYAAVSPTAKDLYTVTATENGDAVVDLTSNDEYEPWGIEYDGDKDAFYYKGEQVMLFEDSVALDTEFGADGAEIDSGMFASKCSYYNPDGKACIKTVRKSTKNDDGSDNPFGEITAIEKLTDNEIDELIKAHTNNGNSQYTYVIEDDFTTEVQSEQTAYSEVTVYDDFETREGLNDAYEKYADLGLEYAYAGGNFKMSFDGKDVHALYDEKEGVWIANNMHGYDLKNSVDLEAVYKNGKLTGFDVEPCEHKDGARPETGVAVTGKTTRVAAAGEAAQSQNDVIAVSEEAAESGVGATTTFHTYTFEDRSGNNEPKLNSEATAAEGDVSEGAPLPEMFDKYKKYGIEYKEVKGADGEIWKNLYYKGDLVNSFSDVSPKGSVFTFGSREQSKDGVNVRTVYKNGKLSGVETY